METTAIDEFDYLYVTVKSVTVEKITAGYETLGWECVKTEKHSRYFNEQNLTFRRPHSIDHKDERQLMQVYLESAINSLGKLASNPKPKTCAFLIIVGLELLALIGFGVWAVLTALIMNGVIFIGGITITAVGLLLFIPYGVIAKKLSDYERKKAKALQAEYYETVNRICSLGIRFLGGADE